MFDSKSPIVKYVGYFIIGFFSIIIIISFGMPDFMSKMGMDKSTVAIINGEKVHRFDYLDYKRNIVSRYGPKIASMYKDEMLMSWFVHDQLKLQKIKEMGFAVTDDRVADYIHETYKDKETNKLDVNWLKAALQRNNSNIYSFQQKLKDDFVKEDFGKFLTNGIPYSSEDIKYEYTSKNSQLKIKYAFISRRELKKRFRNQIKVSKKEITDELFKNKSKVKDPKSDKFKAKKRIENRKFNKLKDTIVNSINQIAKKNGSFNQANALLKGKIGFSKTFKLGETIKENKKNGKSLRAINNSRIFLNDFLKMNTNQTSKVIENISGFYIFTPVMKNVKIVTPDAKESKKIAQQLKRSVARSLEQNMMKYFIENSKIIKNFKN